MESVASHSVEPYLVFVAAGAELAVALHRVSEIVPYARVAAVPAAPDYIRGVVHVRGRVLPVVDLALKFGRPAETIGKRTSIVVLELDLEGMRVPLGIVTDSVATLVEIDRALIKPPPRFGIGLEVVCLEGVYTTAERTLPLLDVVRVFSDEELLRAALAEQRALAEAERQSELAKLPPPVSPARVEPAPAEPEVAAPKLEMELWDDA